MLSARLSGVEKQQDRASYRLTRKLFGSASANNSGLAISPLEPRYALPKLRAEGRDPTSFVRRAIHVVLTTGPGRQSSGDTTLD